MASSAYPPHLPPIFTHHQQELIGHIVNTKITEFIASEGLVCSHCSSGSSRLPSSPGNSKVSVPTTPLQDFDKQLTIFEHQLSEQATKLQQLIDNRSGIGAYISIPSTESVAANLSTSENLVDKLANVMQRLINLEHRFKQIESSMIQSSNLKRKSENIDFTRWLNKMHANFETTMSKLLLALKQTVSDQQQLESTNCTKSTIECNSSFNVDLEKCVTDLAGKIVSVQLNNKQLQSDVDNLTFLHLVAVDKHEVLSTLVSNIGHEHNELAEFVLQLSQCTASADDVIKLKTIVECMARVTGVSEHKAEQLIAEFIGREVVDLEHLRREQRLADDKLRELQLTVNQMTNMHNPAYNNQLPYLNVVIETMQRECKRYKRDLNTMAKKLSERLNAKVAQAIQQSLAEQHEQSTRAQSVLTSTEYSETQLRSLVSTHSSSKISTEMLQPVAEDDTFTKAAAAATAALDDEIKRQRYQSTLSEIKDNAIFSPLPSANIQAETSSGYTYLQQKKELSKSNEPIRLQHDTSPYLRPLKPDLNMSESDSESLLSWGYSMRGNPQKLDLESISSESYLAHEHSTESDSVSLISVPDETTHGLTFDEHQNDRLPVINCLVVGDKSAEAHRLVQTYANEMSGNSFAYACDVSVDVRVAARNGTVYNFRLTNCSISEKLGQIKYSDITVICYSVINKVSFTNVQNVWLKWIKALFPHKPYLLVGTQINKRRKNGIKKFQVDYEQGYKLSREIGAVAYFECSELDVDGVEDMFKNAVQHALGNMDT